MDASWSARTSTRKRPLHSESPSRVVPTTKRQLGDAIEMDETRALMKRSKSLVSKSSEALSTEGSGTADRKDVNKNESPAIKRNERFNLQSCPEQILSPSRERLAKRRILPVTATAKNWAQPDLHAEIANGTPDSEGAAAIQEHNERRLPDPSADQCPDDFVLQLLKAQLDIDLEVKSAQTLHSFFAEVSEEQVAAYNTQVVGCVRNNDLEGLKKLQEEGQALDCFNRFGESLLHMACRRGFESIVQYLMECGAVEVRVSDDCGRTPLHDACWNPSPQLKICGMLIERDPALFLISDRRGSTAFQYARKEHWQQWRNFLYDKRDCLNKLKHPDTLSRFSKC